MHILFYVYFKYMTRNYKGYDNTYYNIIISYSFYGYKPFKIVTPISFGLVIVFIETNIIHDMYITKPCFLFFFLQDDTGFFV